MANWNSPLFAFRNISAFYIISIRCLSKLIKSAAQRGSHVYRVNLLYMPISIDCAGHVALRMASPQRHFSPMYGIFSPMYAYGQFSPEYVRFSSGKPMDLPTQSPKYIIPNHSFTFLPSTFGKKSSGWKKYVFVSSLLTNHNRPYVASKLMAIAVLFCVVEFNTTFRRP